MIECEKLLQNLDQVDPPPCLCEKIIKKIALRKQKRMLLKRTLIRTAAFLTAILTIGSLGYSFLEIAGSSFPEYASLILSDGQLVASNISDFCFLLAESLPLTGIAVTLILASAFLWFSRIAFKAGQRKILFKI